MVCKAVHPLKVSLNIVTLVQLSKGPSGNATRLVHPMNVLPKLVTSEQLWNTSPAMETMPVQPLNVLAKLVFLIHPSNSREGK